MPDADMTIDELARASGMTVRNIRAHQSRGLLPPPEVRARTGYYGPEHVARLRLIQELQGEGYNLAAIKHLLERSDTSAQDILRFTDTLLAPAAAEQPEVVELAGAARAASRAATASCSRAPSASASSSRSARTATSCRARRCCAPARRSLALGVPLPRALDIVERLRKNADEVSRTFVKLFLDQVWRPFDEAGRPEDEWPQVRDTLGELRPLVSDAFVAIFQQRMSRGVEKAFGRELEKRAKG